MEGGRGLGRGGGGGGGRRRAGENAAHHVVGGDLLMSHIDNCLPVLYGRRRGGEEAWRGINGHCSQSATAYSGLCVQPIYGRLTLLDFLPKNRALLPRVTQESALLPPSNPPSSLPSLPPSPSTPSSPSSSCVLLVIFFNWFVTVCNNCRVVKTSLWDLLVWFTENRCRPAENVPDF